MGSRLLIRKLYATSEWVLSSKAWIGASRCRSHLCLPSWSLKQMIRHLMNFSAVAKSVGAKSAMRKKMSISRREAPITKPHQPYHIQSLPPRAGCRTKMRCRTTRSEVRTPDEGSHADNSHVKHSDVISCFQRTYLFITDF